MMNFFTSGKNYRSHAFNKGAINDQYSNAWESGSSYCDFFFFRDVKIKKKKNAQEVL